MNPSHLCRNESRVCEEGADVLGWAAPCQKELPSRGNLNEIINDRWPPTKALIVRLSNLCDLSPWPCLLHWRQKKSNDSLLELSRWHMSRKGLLRTFRCSPCSRSLQQSGMEVSPRALRSGHLCTFAFASHCWWHTASSWAKICEHRSSWAKICEHRALDLRVCGTAAVGF